MKTVRSSPLALPLYVMLLWLSALGACSWAARRWLSPTAGRPAEDSALLVRTASSGDLRACEPAPQRAAPGPGGGAPAGALLLSAAR